MIKCNNTKCKKQTTNAKFCSRTCAAIVNNKVPKRIARKRYCKSCNILLDAKRCFYCLGCKKTRTHKYKMNELSKQTLGELRKKSNSELFTPSYAHAWVRRHCAYVTSHLPKICSICHYDKHIERCHIKAISDFDESTTIEEINQLENIIILCPNHHWELDNGKLIL